MVWPIWQVGITADFFCTEMVIPIDRRLPGERERELFAISIFYSECGKKFSAVVLYLKKFKRKVCCSAIVENSLYILIT